MVIRRKSVILGMAPRPQEHHGSDGVVHSRAAFPSINFFRNGNTAAAAATLHGPVSGNGQEGRLVRQPEPLSDGDLGTVAGKLGRLHPRKRRRREGGKRRYNKRYWKDGVGG